MDEFGERRGCAWMVLPAYLATVLALLGFFVWKFLAPWISGL